jgi:cyclase
MFYGAPTYIFKIAKELRNNPTKAEKKLWKMLNRKQLGIKFRRQHPIKTYIADFYCHEKKLVIEIDGGYHLKRDQIEYDNLRSEEITKFGIKVIRFKNEEVLNSIGNVLEEIKSVIVHRVTNP